VTIIFVKASEKNINITRITNDETAVHIKQCYVLATKANNF